MTKQELEYRVWELYNRGYYVCEIARELDITEYEVCKILRKQ